MASNDQSKVLHTNLANALATFGPHSMQYQQIYRLVHEALNPPPPKSTTPPPAAPVPEIAISSPSQTETSQAPTFSLPIRLKKE
ncbi:hypothetical protein EJ06DRAFT_555711 [Trichodelitschia bisporula]|uniref:Uncharacterized protein n=1 Tax=Trichodelitschia bisporula TaxID=703511 RepID=A0A6G1HYH8_9PEZI|nr:hypothetical protein EJ06DRAFT_555711 [Trichodelitschia bisporula]